MKLHKAFCIGNCLKIMITFGFHHTPLEVGCYFIPVYRQTILSYVAYTALLLLNCNYLLAMLMKVHSPKETILPGLSCRWHR